jgi:hypothetical protein
MSRLTVVCLGLFRSPLSLVRRRCVWEGGRHGHQHRTGNTLDHHPGGGVRPVGRARTPHSQANQQPTTHDQRHEQALRSHEYLANHPCRRATSRWWWLRLQPSRQVGTRKVASQVSFSRPCDATFSCSRGGHVGRARWKTAPWPRAGHVVAGGANQLVGGGDSVGGAVTFRILGSFLAVPVAAVMAEVSTACAVTNRPLRPRSERESHAEAQGTEEVSSDA